MYRPLLLDSFHSSALILGMTRPLLIFSIQERYFPASLLMYLPKLLRLMNSGLPIHLASSYPDTIQVSEFFLPVAGIIFEVMGIPIKNISISVINITVHNNPLYTLTQCTIISHYTTLSGMPLHLVESFMLTSLMTNYFSNITHSVGQGHQVCL